MTTQYNSATDTRQQTLSINRIFNLAPAALWKAWSEPESFKKWWGPKEYTCPHSSIDFKVGGKYLACMKAKDGTEIWSTGIYKEIVSLQKIVYTDSFADSNGNVVDGDFYNMPEMPIELLVPVTLEDVNGNTNMQLQHSGIPASMHEDCIKGWQSSFDKLESNVK